MDFRVINGAGTTRVSNVAGLNFGHVLYYHAVVGSMRSFTICMFVIMIPPACFYFVC